MATLQELATQVLSNINGTGVRTVINDRSLRVQNAVTAPSVYLFGTTNNLRVDADNNDAVVVNEPLPITNTQQADILLNHSSDGRPSELRLMYQSALTGGATNIFVVAISKTVVSLMKNLSATDTAIPVATPYSNSYTTLDLPVPGTPVFGAAAAVVGDFLWLFGGVDANGNTTNAIQRYSFADNAWVTSSVTLPDFSELEDTGSQTSETGVAHMACHVGDPAGGDVVVSLVGGSYYVTSGGTTTEESTDFGAEITIPVTGGGAAAATGVTAADRLLEVSASTVTLSRSAIVFDPLNSGGTGLHYVLGGWDGNTTAHDHTTGAISTIWSAAFTTTTDLTDTSETLATAKAGVTAYYDNATPGAEKIVAVGGQAAGVISDEVEEIAVPGGASLTAGGVVASITLNTARAYAQAVRIDDSDRVWLIGGETSVATVPTRTSTQNVEVIDTAATSPSWYLEPEFTIPGSGWFPAVPPRIPIATGKIFIIGGAAYDTVNSILSTYSASTFVAYRLNVGFGNLDELSGFTTIDGSTVTSINIQIDQEIITVNAFTVSRGADGKEYDSFTASARGALGSTAATHLRRSDVYEDQEALYDDLEDTYSTLVATIMDNVVLPWRAYADSPFLAAGSNFAWALAYWCWLKSREIGLPSIGFISVLPPWTEQRTRPTVNALNTWADYLNNFDRTNNSSTEIWKIADGTTDADGDEIPDNYAFWATEDGNIPTTIPPQSSEQVITDDGDNPIDIGKYIAVCTQFGNAFENIYIKKFGETPMANQFIMQMGHVAYAGQVAAIAPPAGTTKAVVSGLSYAGVTANVSKLQAMSQNRYTVAKYENGSLKIDDGRTFGFYISPNVRTDFTQLSTIRIVLAIVAAIRNIAEDYIGKPMQATTQSMKAEIEEALNTIFVGANRIISYELSITSRPDQVVIGEEEINISIEPVYERRRVLVGVSLAGGFTAQSI